MGCITFRDGLRLASSATTEQVFAKIGSPDAKAFTTLTQGYLKHQDVAGALRVLETALEQRVQVSRCGAGVSISEQRPKLEMQLRRLAFSLDRWNHWISRLLLRERDPLEVEQELIDNTLFMANRRKVDMSSTPLVRGCV